MENTLRKFETGFSMIPNEMLNDTTITLKAKGLYCFMFSKPDKWNFTIRSMEKQLKDGKQSIMSSMKELKSAGWLAYKKNPDGTGQYFLIKPNPDFKDVPNPEKAMFRKPERISNTDINSNTDSKKEKLIKETTIDFDKLLSYINKKTGRGFKVINDQARRKFKARLKEGYDRRDIVRAIDNAIRQDHHKENGFQYLTPEFFSRASTMEKYGSDTTAMATTKQPEPYEGIPVG